jgi:hypothetical protein
VTDATEKSYGKLLSAEYGFTRFGETFYTLDAQMRREQQDKTLFVSAGLIGGIVKFGLEGPSNIIYGAGKLDNTESIGITEGFKGSRGAYVPNAGTGLDIIKNTEAKGKLSFDGDEVSSLDGLRLGTNEKKTWTDLVNSGNDVDLIPTSNVSGEKVADSFLNGVKTELKAMTGSNPNTLIGRIEDSLRKPETQLGLIDVRNGNLTAEQAASAIQSALKMNKIPDGTQIIIWTKQGFVTYP